MDFEFFGHMTASEARSFLEQFINAGRDRIGPTAALATQDGVEFDYSIAKLPSVLRWFAGRLRGKRVPITEEVPQWVVAGHTEGRWEFDEESRELLLQAAYYLGECFARLPGLSWATGDPEYIEKHMPVIRGFRSGQELPPLLVAENLFASVVGDGRPLDEVDASIRVWLTDVAGR